MLQKMTRDERIAAMRKQRITWHNCQLPSMELKIGGHSVWFVNRGGWRPGVVEGGGRVFAYVKGADNLKGRSHKRRYEELRQRRDEFNGDDIPLEPVSTFDDIPGDSRDDFADRIKEIAGVK